MSFFRTEFAPFYVFPVELSRLVRLKGTQPVLSVDYIDEIYYVLYFYLARYTFSHCFNFKEVWLGCNSWARSRDVDLPPRGVLALLTMASTNQKLPQKESGIFKKVVVR